MDCEGGDGDLATYAAVDKSKKKAKKKKAIQLQSAPDEVDPMQEMYAVPDKTKKNSVKTDQDDRITERSGSLIKKKPEPPPPFASRRHESASEASTFKVKHALTTPKILISFLVVGVVLILILLITFILSVTAIAQNENRKKDTNQIQLNTESEDLKETIASLLKNQIQTMFGKQANNPLPSCRALYLTSSSSGYYWITASNGSAVLVYCDMTRSCGGVTGGWMRVAELDMTNSSHQCPSGLTERTSPTGQTEPRTCVSTNTSASCSDGTFFDTIITSYTQVCGKIIGYQIAGVNGFREESRQVGIDSYYVDGVSLTYGSPRQHIWTFAAARQLTDLSQCPEQGTPPARYSRNPPNFVGTNYFCDTGEIGATGLAFYADHPLWDCEDESMNCGSSSSPPWFYKQLPQPTTDNIEMRVCRDEPSMSEDVAIELIQLYVQ